MESSDMELMLADNPVVYINIHTRVTEIGMQRTIGMSAGSLAGDKQDTSASKHSTNSR